ncbi:MAG: DUF4956 domain-containing protein [Erysipelotrichaceae bacterium]|nr:DUF4956 domain-containing protein [Erysipelotrichaceae bacterium]
MLNSILSTPIQLSGLLICLSVAAIFGLLVELIFSFKNQLSPSFKAALVLLPVAMCMVVMMVNGNFGIAVAVAGSFTLVRFRSIAGNGKEITAIFIVMTLGVILGMGYVGIALIFTLIVAVVVILLGVLGVENDNWKLLKITIPEDYDYSELFDDIFKNYGVQAEIVKIKSTNLGSLIDLTYKAKFKDSKVDKKMIDEIKTRNSNLAVMVATYDLEREGL